MVSALSNVDGSARERTDAAVSAEARVTSAVAAHYEFVWRSLRRLGVPVEGADDAAQEVFCVFAKRAKDVAIEKEKSFLFGVAMRVAQAARRKRSRRSSVEADGGGDDRLSDVPSDAAGPDALVDAARARATLDALLARMPPELRAVFVLHEIEEMTMAEVAIVLDRPPGTVASCLRRARGAFHDLVQALGDRR
jgi:RNA polymerase sigma-70 factor (ECF subfamily)